MAKFVDDTKALLSKGTPMPGTLLDPRPGLPDLVPTDIRGSFHSHTFPNRMIKKVLRSQVLELIKPGITPAPDMETVRRLIEAVLSNQQALKAVNGLDGPMVALKYYRLDPVTRISVRKLMSRYWENYSLFALDLGGAVMRQGIFVDK